MKNITALVGWLLIVVALGFFVYGSWVAIDITWNQKLGADGKLRILPEALDTGIASIGALLLTNLGAVLGISVANPSSALAKSVIVGHTTPPGGAVTPPLNSREKVQVICMLVFLLALIANLVTWLRWNVGAEVKPVLTNISQSVKILLGVVGAYLGFILGRS